MSHRVDLSLKFTKPTALRKACEALGIPFQEGRQKVQLFAGQSAESDFTIQLPGWKYKMAINLETGTASFDNYNGQWGEEKYLTEFRQEYALQVAEEEPGIQELLTRGWTATRVRQENGELQTVFEEP